MSNQPALSRSIRCVGAVSALTQDQIMAEIDRVARRQLGMSGYQMLELNASGALADAGSVRDDLDLADLLDVPC